MATSVFPYSFIYLINPHWVVGIVGGTWAKTVNKVDTVSNGDV